MNALFNKIGLKQKFFVIFCIVTFFSLYQIVSDTIILNQSNKKNFEKQSNDLIFIQKLNQFIYTLQKDILELKLNAKSQTIQKLSILRKTEKLLNDLNQIMIESFYKEEYNFIHDELDYIIKNIHMLSYHQIILKYDLIYEKIFINNNYLSNFLNNEYASFSIIKIIHNDIAFILHYLTNIHHFKTSFNLEPLFIQELKNNYALLKSYSMDQKLLLHIQKLHEQLFTYETSLSIPEDYYIIVTSLIDAYSKVNKVLYKSLEEEILKQEEELNHYFTIKLFIEIMALLITLILLSYFYKSLFIYIRKIQNAHKIKSIFLSNMSHELRTPLNAIIGFLNILKESNDEKEQKKFVDIIYKSSKQLLYIINDILDFSKIEDAKLKIEKKPLNIKQEIELLIELFSANASSKNITLESHFSKDIPECIISDKFRIKQILSNLISNAIKFTQEGGIIKVIVQKRDQKLYICVEDNGIGINKKAQKNIFKSFLQANDSTARKFGGTGLGLSISSKLVNLLGSKLKVESKELYGSKFYFYLKIKECKEEHPEIKLQEKLSTYQGTVLLVEDNPTNQFLMQITFSNLKLDVILANDGIEALEKFKNNQVDIIFMDDNMPNKNGVEAARDILEYERQNNLEHTPIIALTANTGSEIKKKLFKAGMDEYMAKPFDIKLLHQILQKYLT